MLAELFQNKLFLSGFLAVLAAQLIKMVVYSIKDKKFRLTNIFELAGMPSSHTATTIALTAAIYFEQGVSSLFIIGLFLSFYVIFDVLTAERTIATHAQIINSLLKWFPGKLKFKPIRERWGHNFLEVFVGFTIGLIIAYLVYLN
jgi:acid phosphatase family membrane protein YuiD